MPRHPIEAARAGAIARIPLIIGTNRREASLFACDKPPMLPTTPEIVDRFFSQLAPDVQGSSHGGLPGLSAPRALVETIGADAMFVAPTWAFADAYSAHAPTYMYRFDHTPATLRLTGLGAMHGSEIVHIQHTYGSHLGRRLHPLGTWWTPAVGRRHAAHLAGLRLRGGPREPALVERMAATMKPSDAQPAFSGLSPRSCSTIRTVSDDPPGPRSSDEKHSDFLSGNCTSVHANQQPAGDGTNTATPG